MKVPIPQGATVAKITAELNGNRLQHNDVVYIEGTIQDCNGSPCVLVVRIDDGFIDIIYVHQLQAINYFKSDPEKVYHYQLGTPYFTPDNPPGPPTAITSEGNSK